MSAPFRSQFRNVQKRISESFIARSDSFISDTSKNCISTPVNSLCPALYFSTNSFCVRTFRIGNGALKTFYTILVHAHRCHRKKQRRKDNFLQRSHSGRRRDKQPYFYDDRAEQGRYVRQDRLSVQQIERRTQCVKKFMQSAKLPLRERRTLRAHQACGYRRTCAGRA